MRTGANVAPGDGAVRDQMDCPAHRASERAGAENVREVRVPEVAHEHAVEPRNPGEALPPTIRTAIRRHLVKEVEQREIHLPALSTGDQASVVTGLVPSNLKLRVEGGGLEPEVLDRPTVPPVALDIAGLASDQRELAAVRRFQEEPVQHELPVDPVRVRLVLHEQVEVAALAHLEMTTQGLRDNRSAALPFVKWRPYELLDVVDLHQELDRHRLAAR